MNCPKCFSQTREVWMTYSSFEYCPECKEDVSTIVAQMKAAKTPLEEAPLRRKPIPVVKVSEAAGTSLIQHWIYDPITQDFVPSKDTQ